MTREKSCFIHLFYSQSPTNKSSRQNYFKSKKSQPDIPFSTAERPTRHDAAEAGEDRRLHGRRDARQRASILDDAAHHLREGAQQDRQAAQGVPAVSSARREFEFLP